MPDPLPQAPSNRFQDSIQAVLALTIGKDTFEYPSGSIDRFAVDLRTWGFDATISFHISAEQADDPLLDAFTGTEPIAGTFSFSREIQGEDEPECPIVRGLVVSRSVVETMVSGVIGAPPVLRLYTIQLRDPAAALWRSHWPVDLYARATMASVLDAQKVAGIELVLDWDELDVQRPLLCLPLATRHGVSFYDFLVWWIDKHGGVLEYTGETGAYRIADKKSPGAKSVDLDQEIVRTLTLRYPEPPRFAVRVRNALAAQPETLVLQNELAIRGLYRDVLVREPVASAASKLADTEALQHRACDVEFEASFSRCPTLLQPPGGVVSLGEGFSTRARIYGQKFRLLALLIEGEQASPDDNEEVDSTVVYDSELRYLAESTSSALPRLPPHASGDLEVYVEGTIVSAGGLETDRSWSATENEDDSLWTYKVLIPLFNLEIPCPFNPLYMPGHFFFPAYKHQRVLVSLRWDRAEIVAFLDWSEEGRLPIDSQGNQIVMGPKLGNGTVVRHSYIDTKPVLHVERKTPEETQVISVADGLIRISLVEEKLPPTTMPTFDVTLQVEAAKDQVASKVQGGVSAVVAQHEKSAGAVEQTVAAASDQVDEQVNASSQRVFAALDAGDGRLQTLGNELGSANGQVAAQSAAAQASVRAAAPSTGDARARIAATRLATEARLRGENAPATRIASALEPLDRAVATLDASEREIEQLVGGALSAIQSAEAAIGATIRGVQASTGAVLDGTSEALAGVRRGVAALSATVRRPLAVLDELVPKLQLPFKTATSALTQVVTAADSALGAIKASGLPKALVEPAVTAIQAATGAILPTIDPLVSQAVSQLDRLAQTFQQQVTTAQQAALALLTAQEKQLIEMVNGIASPLETQIAAAKSGVDEALQNFTQATDRMSNEAVQALKALEVRIGDVR